MAAIVIVAVALAAEIARLTLASAYAEDRPDLAARLAPRFPDVLVSQSMAQVGEAAAVGQTPPGSTIGQLRALTMVAPLAAEPFLVHAAIAQRGGDLDRAERLLLQARLRDPRSSAARYLLADAWLRQNRVSDGLGEIASLARLLPRSSVQLVPALAEYARSPEAPDQLTRILTVNPRLKQPLLSALAADPDNVELILRLDSALPDPDQGAAPRWQARLIGQIVAQGDYERAYSLWQRLARFEGQRPLLFNGEFRAIAAPPPFNWTFASTGAGFAEPENGYLRVLHYGRQDTRLASQLLLLAPGRYRISNSASGSGQPGGLEWLLSCVKSRNPILVLELGPTGSSRRDFDVPASGCPAQTVELRGRAQDMPKESDVRLGPLIIERVG